MNGESTIASVPLFHSAPQIFGCIGGSTFEPLVSDAKRSQLIELAAQFPAAVQTACYESRLHSQASQVDLALCLLPGFETGRSVSALCRGADRGVAWERTANLLGDWTSGGNADLVRVPFMWVAFDIDDRMLTLPAPCLGVCVEEHFFARRVMGDAIPAEADEDWVTAVAKQCYRTVFAQGLPEPLFTRVQSVLRFPAVRAKHLSFMLGREPKTVKLDVALPVHAVAPLLRTLEWPGPAEETARAIQDLLHWKGDVQLNLVLHPAMQQPLEVEFLTRGANNQARLALLERLVELGLASPEKAEVLRQVWRDPHLETNGGLGGKSVVGGWYIKVRFNDGVPTEAKTYLGLMPRISLRPGLSSEDNSIS